MSARTDHVVHVAGPGRIGTLKCLHCGDERPLGDAPIPLTEYTKTSAAFVARHKDCPPPPAAVPEAQADADAAEARREAEAAGRVNVVPRFWPGEP